MFITFEGIDSSGKSTQIKKLSAALKNLGKKVLVVREPGGTHVSEAIRAVLLNKNFKINSEEELLLFTAARANLVSNLIIPKLKIGSIILCDRFGDSTIAYQSFGRGLKRKTVEAINNFATQNLKPHLTFVIDIPIVEMLKRSHSSKKINDRMEENKHEFFENVRRGYSVLAKEEPARVKIINGLQSIETIHKLILKTVLKKLI